MLMEMPPVPLPCMPYAHPAEAVTEKSPVIQVRIRTSDRTWNHFSFFIILFPPKSDIFLNSIRILYYAADRLAREGQKIGRGGFTYFSQNGFILGTIFF